VDNGLQAFAGLPLLVPPPTAAERAADVIRESIFNGRFRPGMALPESSLANALQVSRNTVRDAFRTLVHERLLTYVVNKGVAVRCLSAADVHDIYRLRGLYELSAVDLLSQGPAKIHSEILSALRKSVDQGEAAADRAAAAPLDSKERTEATLDLGTADLDFHTHLVSLHHSPRLDEAFRALMTELRLGFLSNQDQYPFHQRYLPLNRSICADLEAGRYDSAHATLARYLNDAQAEVQAAVVQAAVVQAAGMYGAAAQGSVPQAGGKQ
jgi:DNA-binding GntR family transcriptional regulator